MSSHAEHDSIRFSQLVEDFHPVLRRRAITSIRTTFPSFFSTETQPNILSMNESQKLITQNFSKINHIIDMVDEHIRRRIECYENEVVNLVQKQISQMKEQTQKVVTQFNSMIQEKNKENEIWSLNNELDYFKSQAKKLFDMNRTFKKENLELKKKIKDYEWELQNREVIMQKLLYKYQKEKHHKTKLKQKMTEQLKNIHKIFSEQRSPFNFIEFSIQDDAFEINDLSVPQIRLDLKKPAKEQPSENVTKQIRAMAQEGNDNSLLAIDCEDESEESKIQFECKSIKLSSSKPQVREQQTQVNIYLSEHQYKTLFQKKNPQAKKINVQSKQAAIQTDRVEVSMIWQKQRENLRSYSGPKKQREINLLRNGFYVNQVNTHKTHYRSNSTHFNTTAKTQPDCRPKHQYLKQSTQKGARMITENNFEQAQITNDLFPKNKAKDEHKFYEKMVNKFKTNKIVGKVYNKEKRKLQSSIQN